jgi:hypothetical protein
MNDTDRLNEALKKIVILVGNSAKLQDQLAAITKERDKWHQLVKEQIEDDEECRELLKQYDTTDSHHYCSTQELVELCMKERDELRAAWERANEHMSDAWALSVDYDGFGHDGKALRGLIDDIVHNMNLGRKVMNDALKESHES